MPVRSDLDARLSAVRALGPVAVTSNTDTDSTTIDLGAFPGWRVLLVGLVGSRTDGTYTFKFRESDDDSSYADRAPYSGSLANVGAANTMRQATIQPTKRYLRARVTSAAVTTGATVTALVLLVPPAV